MEKLQLLMAESLIRQATILNMSSRQNMLISSCKTRIESIFKNQILIQFYLIQNISIFHKYGVLGFWGFGGLFGK